MRVQLIPNLSQASDEITQPLTCLHGTIIPAKLGTYCRLCFPTTLRNIIAKKETRARENTSKSSAHYRHPLHSSVTHSVDHSHHARTNQRTLVRVHCDTQGDAQPSVDAQKFLDEIAITLRVKC